MFVLTCNIEIGGVSFNSVNEVVIKRSLYDLAATAIIKLPVTAVLKQTGEPTTHTETAKAIQAGDKVSIKLGYDNKNNIEFNGYIKRLNLRVPLEVEAEDEYYNTRFINCVFSAKQTTLKQVLNAVLLTIKQGFITDLTLKNFIVDNKPGSWLLGYLKKEYGLSVWFDLNGALYICRPTDVTGESVNYRLRYNVINDEDLKFQFAKDTRLKIKAVCYYQDGEKIEAEIGEEGGENKTLYFYDVTSQSELKALAEAELKRYCFDGYRGKILTFLQPFALPGMVAQIEDTIYQDRDGTYLIESIETTFGTGGGRRRVEIGIKV